MTDTLYPIFYGTRMVTMEALQATFVPHMHPEFARRLFEYIRSMNGLVGIGGGYRPPGTQPNKTGFAPPGKSFHEGQKFPSGVLYSAVDLVAVNPGNVHRHPNKLEAPQQGSDWARKSGVHINTAEEWHIQPVELDGYDTWIKVNKPDLNFNYPIIMDSVVSEPAPPTPTPPPPIQTQGVTVEFSSRNLVEGTSGPDVKFFQRILNDIAGQNLLLDGGYGPKTTQAVKNWQMVFGLGADGQMGPKTQRSLIEQSLLHS